MSVTKRTVRFILVAGAVAALALTALARATPPTGAAGSTAEPASRDLVADPGFVDVLALRGDRRGGSVSAACEPTCSCECD
jgi:hypothetical protein